MMQNTEIQTADSEFYTASQHFHREVVGNEYRMAHHNIANWAIICKKLQPIADGDLTFEEIVETVSFFTNDEQLQSKHRRRQTTPTVFMLNQFFSSLTQQERIFYQRDLLPNIAKLILETEALFPDSQRISILAQDQNQKITLSKRQCACLIAHMAFCLTVDQAEGFKLPELIDFSVIYSKPGLPKNIARKNNKIRCLFTYFEKFLAENPRRNVVFERLALEGTHNEQTWSDCDETITKAQVITEGCIEDTINALQVVFSDKELGDQVLQLPATQQQIMSLIHPELMLSLLFCEELKIDETVSVSAAGRYSNYRGYGDTFEFAGPYEGDENPIEREHVIMDAAKYNSKQAQSQFDTAWVLRELNKAYSGFTQTEENGRRVATGKWGCGVFKGNPQLKFIIQWLAASRAQRDLVFYSYGDVDNFKIEEREKILSYYIGREVRDLFEDLTRAAMEMQTISETGDENKNLFRVLIVQKGL